MVSFVCDGCGDVVKKPKLQQHYNRCYSSFTCLDCSVQFLTPKDAHSSCITEDEKYQKSLYKGKKNVEKQQGQQPKTQSQPAKETITSAQKRKFDDDYNTKTEEKTSDKRAKSTSKDEKDTLKESTKPKNSKELSVTTIQNMAQQLSNSRKSLTLHDIIKHTAKELDIDTKKVKSFVLKKAGITVKSQGKMAFIEH